MHHGGHGVDVERRHVASLGDAGVVYQEVDATEGVHHVDGQLVDRVGVGQVDRPHPAVRRVLHAAGDHLGQPVGPTGTDTDHRPPLGQRHGQPCPDARGAPRD